MRRWSLLVSLGIVAALVGGLARANHGCNGSITQIPAAEEAFHVDDRGVGTGGLWIYRETNGEVGLQSGGGSTIGFVADPCDHGSPDMLIATTQA